MGMRFYLLIISLFFGLLADAQPLAKHSPKRSSRAYQFVRAVTIDYTQFSISGDLTNRDYTVTITANWLKTEANGGNIKNANGYDIVPFLESNLATALKFRRERYNGTTGEIVLSVKLPTIYYNQNTVFHIGYCNSAITTDQQDKANSVDGNTQVLWTVADGTTLSGEDITSNANTATIVGSATAVAGIVDGAASFNGSTQYLSRASTGSLEITGDITVSCWVKTTSGSTSALVSKYTSGDNGWVLFYNGNTVQFDGRDGSTNYRSSGASTATVNSGTWKYVVGQRTGTTWKVFVNGTQENSTNVGTSGSISNTNALEAAALSPTHTNKLNGSLDQIRVDNVARSADWIKIDYVAFTNSSAHTIGDAF